MRIESYYVSDGGYGYFGWRILDEAGAEVWRSRIITPYPDIHQRNRAAAETKLAELEKPKPEPKLEPCGYCGSTEPLVDDGNGSWPYCPDCKGI